LGSGLEDFELGITYFLSENLKKKPTILIAFMFMISLEESRLCPVKYQQGPPKQRDLIY